MGRKPKSRLLTLREKLGVPENGLDEAIANRWLRSLSEKSIATIDLETNVEIDQKKYLPSNK